MKYLLSINDFYDMLMIQKKDIWNLLKILDQSINIHNNSLV